MVVVSSAVKTGVEISVKIVVNMSGIFGISVGVSKKSPCVDYMRSVFSYFHLC